MNERIRPLYYECQDESQSTEQCYQKFAELIVRECMEWCDAHATINGSAQQIRNSIKNHFGVEE
jgi:hypothetical protein